MGRLKAMPPRVARLEPRVSAQTDSEGHSRAETWRAWYSTARWRRLKAEVHRRDLYTCQCGCGTAIADPAERVADHREEHNGDPGLFWDPQNVQTLWKPHHDGWKQRLERRRRLGEA